MSENKKKNRYLFAIDLDGTLLSSSMNGTVGEISKQAIERAKKEGHIVCFLTGRPWRSTKPIYERMGMNTIVTNYNGAHIHNPTDEDFIPYVKYLNLNEILYIMGDPIVKKEITNIAIEGPGWVQLQHRDEPLENIFGLNTAPRFKIGIDINKIPLRPTGVIFDVKRTTNAERLRKYLRGRYGDLGEFSYWSKGEGETPVFDITNVTVNKGRAISFLSRYYDILPKNIVAIGDSFNDVPMFKIANVSVAVGNASGIVKKHAKIRLTKTNKEDAVGDFINRFLDNPEKEIQKIKTRNRRRKNNHKYEENGD